MIWEQLSDMICAFLATTRFQPLASFVHLTPQPKAFADQHLAFRLGIMATSHSRGMASSQAAPVHLSSEHQAIMTRHRLSRPTIRSLTLLPRAPEPMEILRCASSATELRSFVFNPLEKGAFSAINNDPSTRWPVKEQLTQPWHKVYLVAQCEASGGDYGARLCRAARVDLLSSRTQIVKVLGQEGKATELLQVPDIGPKKIQKLVEAGVMTVRRLSELDFFDIERILSRNPPFGQNMVQILAHFPRLVLSVDIPKRDGAEKKLIVRTVLGCANVETPVWKGKEPWVSLAAETSDGRLAFFWRGQARSLMSGKELVFPVEANTGGQTVFVWASCEEIAGTVVTAEVAV
ncbi:hypothetical protein Cob_v010505 [Colletotrichum orbiculare MAFF 240422]|uniref:SEC63 domain-containing protein n=1 Tax=Colletotrichum orbiculare (strain 104-T / ATCC 96160 / CBS 514.97 / LARS 414 / MAFF 240422) TaxID=1213857 RepID=A0A484FEU1_COLOR|nr:hypothetical protein Cob_v010505 [Colletotrichum orbiculare MAFF 240422]